MRTLYYIRNIRRHGAALLCAAVLLTGCGEAQEESTQPAPQETAVSSAAESSAGGGVEVEILPDIAPRTPAGSSGEHGEANGYTLTAGSAETAVIELDRKSLDPEKPFTPEGDQFGTGKTAYVYPMNSLILRLREAPFDSSKQTAQLLAGTEVKTHTTLFFDLNECWSYVSSEEGSGWCHANDITGELFEWLSFEEVELPLQFYEHAVFSDGICEVTNGKTALYSAPDKSSRKLGKIKKGSEIRAFGDSPRAKGWLFAAVSAEYLEEGGTGEVYGWVYTGDGKNVRYK